MAKAKRQIAMTPPHPGAFVRDEVLEPLGLSITEAADVLGVRRATLSDFIAGKAGLSPEMALRLELAFGLDMEQMLAMQTWHDARAMDRRRGEFRVKRYQPA